MNFTQILRSLQARRSVILSIILLCMATAVTASLLFEKSYVAGATLLLPPAASVATEVEIISSKTLAMTVVDALKLAELPSLQQEFQVTAGSGNLRVWIAERLLANLQVISRRGSKVVHINYRSSSPDEAAAMANAFVRGYLQTADRRESAPVSDAELLDPAYPPADATAMPLWTVTMLAILSVAVFGVMFVLFSEYRDRHVHSEIDLVDAVPAPFLGALGPLHAPPVASGRSAESRLRFWRNRPWKT